MRRAELERRLGLLTRRSCAQEDVRDPTIDAVIAPREGVRDHAIHREPRGENMGLRSLVLLIAWLAVISHATAQETGDVADPLALQIHGFASQGFMLTTVNNYLAKTEHGSFELTEVGVNFTKPLTNDLRTGVQLFSRKLGSTGNYTAKFDWFYLDYRWRDWLGIRAGRVKLPFGLYNEINDADSARVPVLLPQSVYPISNRDYLLAQTGGELYGRVVVGAGGTLDYRLYGGTIFIDVTQPPGSPYQVKSLDVPYVAGGRLLWETPLPGLRAGGSLQFLRLDTDLLFDPALWTPLQTMGALPASFKGDVQAKVEALLWVGSVEYSANDLLLAAEYSRWHIDADSSQMALFPGPKAKTSSISERLYGMAAYRVTRWFQPGLYYSLLFPDVDHRSGPQSMQHDVAGTLRFDINDHWLVKLEGHYMRGTAALSSALNDNLPLAQLAPSWALFLIKTTAYF
jgi:hypothetical protein